MHFLAIDTATNSGGVAVSRNGEVVASVMCKTPMEYSDRLIGYIDFLLNQLNLTLSEVGCLAVATGPGSFTGLRIGIATAKALGLAMDCPTVGITTLEALAWRYRWLSLPVAPMIDARRQQVYAALYEVRGREIHSAMDGCVLPPAEWLNALPEGEFVFVGDGAQMYSQTIKSLHPDSRVLTTDNCIVKELCEVAYTRFSRGGAGKAGELQASYIRPSDAELGR